MIKNALVKIKNFIIAAAKKIKNVFNMLFGSFTKRCIALILCAIIILSLCIFLPMGCKKNEESTGITSPISKIALVTGETELELDYSNAAVWEGIVSCSEASGIEYASYTPEALTEEAIHNSFVSAIDEGATVVVCMGDAYIETVATLQDEYPNVKFIAIDASAASIGKLNGNTHCIMFRQEQGGYLAGYGAVKDGFTKLGFMGVHETETYQSYCYGFIQGANEAAQELNVEIEIKIAYASDYEVEEEAVALCNSWYATGTEIVMAAGDEFFASECAKAAVDNFGYIIGTNVDQTYIGSDYDYNPFMTSAVKGLQEVTVATLEMMLGGSWDMKLGGQTEYFGLQNGNYVYLPNDEGIWLFETFTLDEYSSLVESIATGKVNVSSKSMPNVNSELVTVLVNGEDTAD